MTITIKYVNNFFGKCKHFKDLKPTIILIFSLPIVHYKQGGKKKVEMGLYKSQFV
jgi:hypothetical protein